MSWDELLEEALVAGLTVEGFWDLDPHETYLVIKAYQRRMSYEDDALAHYAAILFNTQIEKKKDAKKPADLKRLPRLDEHPTPADERQDTKTPGAQHNGQRDKAPSPKRSEAEERDAFRRLKEHRRRENAGVS